MRRTIVLALASCLSLFIAGCNPKVGIVLLDTNPSQATVYLAGQKIGETPVQFELNLRRGATLLVVKEGCAPVTEVLNLAWAQQEFRDGHYTKGDYLIQGKMQTGFQIQTTRDLKQDQFTAWCNSMIGKDYHEIVYKLGLPRQTVDMPNGNKTMIFDRGLQGLKPRFETDPNGKVIRWTP